ncbi:hypothetical protein PAPHI01_1766 [Pancytospora philotis]|nr:hypothetical protein PAPHI01_1766 [Pancytospora philotis]
MASYVSATKVRELESAIAERRFPILVHGPSGSGKTHTIKEILQRQRLKYVYVDLAAAEIRKPIFKGVVVLAELHSTADAERIYYTDTLIVESSLLHAYKLEGFTAVKFNPATAKTMRTHGYSDFNGNLFNLGFDARQQRYSVELYRFLGQIFYGKCSISSISTDREWIYAEIANEPVRLPHKKSLSASVHPCSNRKAVPTAPVSLMPPSSASMGDSKRCARRVNVIDSSDIECDAGFPDQPTCDVVHSNGIDDISFDDDDFVLDSQPSIPESCTQSAHSSMISNISADLQEFRCSVSFSRRKVLGYLYENILHFCDLENLSVFYECLSLSDTNDEQFIALVQAVIERAKRPNKAVHFNSLNSMYYGFI